MVYNVSFNVPNRPLGKASGEFIVKDNGAKLSTLKYV